MIALALIVGVLLLLWLSSATRQIERANEDIKREVIAAGATYDASRAGQPLRDGCMLIVLTIVFAIGAVTLLGALVPLP